MRNLKSYISAAAITALLFSAESCQKSFYTKANINPNSPKSVPNGTLLSGVEVTTAFSQGGDYSRYTSEFVQQTVGYNRQNGAYEQYVFTNQDAENAWDNMYDDAMANDYQLMLQASQAGNHEYYGMGQIMMAFQLQTMVDLWGNIPYSQAFRGATNMHPAYDVDKALYDTAISLCWKGIKNCDPTLDATDAVSPDPSNSKYDNLNADVMYAGSGAQWIKFAHAILARLYIHQAKHSNVAMCDSALANANASFASNADNARIVFGTSASNNAPWFQFNNNWGDISFYQNWFAGGYVTFADSELVEKDPRLPIQMDSTLEVSGANVALVGGYYGSPTAPVDLIDYAEMQFVAAEATLRTTGIGAAAQTYYLNGIQADMSKLGVASGAVTTFLAGSQGSILTLTAANAIVQNAWQENIALYLNPEAFGLWRRCNWPLTPISGSAVPRRFLYPQSEINLNGSNVPTATLFTPVVFWDN
ncbi:MAG TPA: SusD/RagB family nutrient-binding outer membrane lipoprotein [Bacteroidia bacterium]|jgi:hypothetical protein|nr:SusD/RagB family nutrient-binding outer membrane lipoprotein [Bacteroidia bacterium]